MREMMGKRRSTGREKAGAILAAATLIVLPTASVHASTEFYLGKRLTVLVNFAPGGPVDIEGRMLARNMARHIPGQPTVIVQNMDGAGGMVGANFIGEVAPRDGTMVGFFTAVAWQYAIESKPRKVPFQSYAFVAAQPSSAVYYMRTNVAPGIRTAADIARSDGIIVGGLTAETSKDITHRLLLDILGVRYKYVTGYRSTNAVRLALQQGEVNWASESPPAYLGIVKPSLIAKGDVIGLFYDPFWDGVSLTGPREMKGEGLLPFQELYRQIKGELPSGKLWESYLTLVGLNGNLFRLVAFPPGVPTAAVEALSLAIQRMRVDKEYEDEANKAYGFVPEWTVGPGVPERIRKALTTTPETKAFFADYVAKASSGAAAPGK